MFDLESTAHRLTNNLIKDVQQDVDQRAKIEYGLSLFLGVAIELIITVGISALFGTALYTILIMLSSLFLRTFTGGAHCSSYRRCVVFTIIVFVGLSFPVRAIAVQTEFSYIIPVIAGLGIQAFMVSPLGRRAILGSDKIMQRFGI